MAGPPAAVRCCRSGRSGTSVSPIRDLPAWSPRGGLLTMGAVSEPGVWGLTLDQLDTSTTRGAGSDQQAGVPWRWLILAAFGLATSLLLTAGVVLMGYRGVASAERVVESTASRPSGVTLVREIGGGTRSASPAPTLGTFPTLLFTPEPSLLASRQGQPSAPPPPAATTPPEPTAADSQPSAPPPPPAPRNGPSAPVVAAREATPTEATPTPTPAASPTATSTPLPVPTFPPLFHLTPSPTATSTPTPAPAIATPAPTATPVRAPAQSADDERPRVTIHLSDTRVDVGDTVTVSVTATDDRGLAWISWEADDSGDWELDSEHREYCDGDKRCSESWKVRVSQPGRHTLQARARDLAGNLSGGADIELKVVAKPTPTPTRQATPTKN